MNEPVYWTCGLEEDEAVSKDIKIKLNLEYYNIPLYTHPVKELTDEEINKIYLEKYDGHMGFLSPDEVKEFARAILRKAQEK